MTNTQKATLRRIARDIMKLRAEAEAVLDELDEYISDHQDTLDGTERGEKLDTESNDLFLALDEFETVLATLQEIAG